MLHLIISQVHVKFEYHPHSTILVIQCFEIKALGFTESILTESFEKHSKIWVCIWSVQVCQHFKVKCP